MKKSGKSSANGAKQPEPPQKGALYVVATPIGNLEDITLRALRILAEVDLIAAEDTRHTRKLLNYYQIKTPTISYYAHNERYRGGEIIGRIKRGAGVALVSDAGTPGISDPGFFLLEEAWRENIPIVSVPGVSAVTAALSVCSLPEASFVFEGYLPAKTNKRRKKLEQIKQENRPLVLFETPHRLRYALADMVDILGERPLVLTRELTKKFEQILRGTPAEIQEKLADSKIRGEFTLVLLSSEYSKS